MPVFTLARPFVSALAGVILSVAGTGLLAYTSTHLIKDYGGTLFLGLPVACGFSSAFLHNLHARRTWGSTVASCLCTLLLLTLGMLAVAFEGIVCLLMAAPLVLPMALFGAWLGYVIAPLVRASKSSYLPPGCLLLILPLLMGAEARWRPEPPVHRVVTAVEIEAPAETVWDSVAAFPPIPEPRELIFRAGIAYPRDAAIVGRGVGAVRYCNFSTGPFVEPITVWRRPELLRFNVTANPPPLREISWYQNVQPPHLHNFMISRQGQFRLIRLGPRRTRLEGTTWYQHRLWPQAYWRVISDEIIHTIHRRVLRHIKQQAEAQS